MKITLSIINTTRICLLSSDFLYQVDKLVSSSAVGGTWQSYVGAAQMQGMQGAQCRLHTSLDWYLLSVNRPTEAANAQCLGGGGRRPQPVSATHL